MLMGSSVFVRKTGAPLLQTLKSWMRTWSTRSGNLSLTLKMKTKVNRSRRVGKTVHEKSAVTSSHLWGLFPELESTVKLV